MVKRGGGGGGGVGGSSHVILAIMRGSKVISLNVFFVQAKLPVGIRWPLQLRKFMKGKERKPISQGQ